MVTDLRVIALIIRVKHCIQCMSCSIQVGGEMLPKIHTMEKCYFLKSTIHFQISKYFVISEMVPENYTMGK